jgi:pSer/pThr/pTyr-binding forkhead associated (FHA) protein
VARVVYRDENYQTVYREVNAQNPEVTIGRNPDNSIVVPSKALSRNHAKIVYQNGRYLFIDLKSSNGCYVNDKRISTQEIQSGDKIRCGTVSFDFVEDSAPAGKIGLQAHVGPQQPQGYGQAHASPQQPQGYGQAHVSPQQPQGFGQSPQPSYGMAPPQQRSAMNDPRNFGARPISSTSTYRPTMLNQPGFEEEMARHVMRSQQGERPSHQNFQSESQLTGQFSPPSPNTVDQSALAPVSFDPRQSGIQRGQWSAEQAQGSNYAAAHVQSSHEAHQQQQQQQQQRARAQDIASLPPQSFDPSQSGLSPYTSSAHSSSQQHPVQHSGQHPAHGSSQQHPAQHSGQHPTHSSSQQHPAQYSGQHPAHGSSQAYPAQHSGQHPAHASSQQQPAQSQIVSQENLFSPDDVSASPQAPRARVLPDNDRSGVRGLGESDPELDKISPPPPSRMRAERLRGARSSFANRAVAPGRSVTNPLGDVGGRGVTQERVSTHQPMHQFRAPGRTRTRSSISQPSIQNVDPRSEKKEELVQEELVKNEAHSENLQQIEPSKIQVNEELVSEMAKDSILQDSESQGVAEPAKEVHDEELEAAYESQSELLNALRELSSEQSQQIAELSEKNKNKSAKLEKQLQSISILEENLERAEKRIAELEENYKSSESSLNTQNEESLRLQELIHEKQATIEENAKHIAELEESIESALAKNFQIEESLNESSEKILLLEQELEDKEKRVHEISEKLQTTANTLEEKNQELSKLHAELEAAKLEQINSQNTNESLLIEVNALQTQLKDGEKAVTDAEKFLSLWRERFDSLKKYSDALLAMPQNQSFLRLSPSEQEQWHSIHEVIAFCHKEIRKGGSREGED